MDIDVDGAYAIKRQFPDNALLIFLKPPNFNVLQQRLKKRASESKEQVKKRLDRMPREVSMADGFDHIIINHTLNETIELIDKLVQDKMKIIVEDI
jgi:guanylate kinase